MRHDEVVAPTPAELATEREWLRQQQPGEANQRADEELKRRGIDFDAAYAAINRGDHDEAKRFLQALAPPPQRMVAALERRINDALRSMSRPAALAQATPAAHVASRPRERKPKRTARTRGSRGDPDPEPEPPLGRRGVSPRQLARDRGNGHVYVGEKFMREWLVMLEEQGRVARVGADRWEPLHPEGSWWRDVASIVDDLVGEREAAA